MSHRDLCSTFLQCRDSGQPEYQRNVLRASAVRKSDLLDYCKILLIMILQVPDYKRVLLQAYLYKYLMIKLLSSDFPA